MYSFSTRYISVFRALIAVCAWVALALQWHIVQSAALSAGLSSWTALGNFLSYFTILTNALIAFSFSVGLVAPGASPSRFFALSSFQTAVAGCIISVSLIYHIALARAWNPQGLQWWTNLFLHDVVPLAYVLHWLFFVPKGRLGWALPLLWMAYPLAYLAWMMGRGALTGFYPYPFVNVTWEGYASVIRHLLVLIVGWTVEFYALVVVDNYMGKHFDKFFEKK
jgi:hypothetical protein